MLAPEVGHRHPLPAASSVRCTEESATCSSARLYIQRPPSHSFLPHSRQGPSRSVPWLGGGKVAFSCPSWYPRFRAGGSLFGETLSLQRKRLVEDRRQEEIFTKLTTFKKINICSLNVVLAAAPFKCGATRLTLRLLPGGETGLGCAGGWAPASDVVAY